MEKENKTLNMMRASLESVASNQVGVHQTARHLIPANLVMQRSEGIKNLTALQQVNQVLMPQTETKLLGTSRIVANSPVVKGQ